MLPIIDTVASLSLPTELDPTIKGKIDAFRAVEAEVESRVVPSWEGYDELASVLHEVVGTTRCLRECRGRRQITLVPKELRTP
jgi:hypothetical protein